MVDLVGQLGRYRKYGKALILDGVRRAREEAHWMLMAARESAKVHWSLQRHAVLVEGQMQIA